MSNQVSSVVDLSKPCSETMSNRERITATIHGDEVDPPVYGERDHLGFEVGK